MKVRSDQVRRLRLRRGAMTVGTLLGALFGLYVCWQMGAWALDRFVYENPAFAIREVQVQTDGILSPEQLRRWAGVRPGQNLFALDLARVKRDLELVPLIESVAVERVVPATLRLRVTEREPVAQLNVPRPDGRGGFEVGVFWLDASGHVMLPPDPRQCTAPLPPEETLPVLTGVGLQDLQPGRRLESPQVRAALELIEAFTHSPMAGLVDLRRIDLSAPEVLVVTTGQGAEVTFGTQNLEQQLRRWREIHELGRRQGRAVAWLDLAVGNNVPVRWADAESLPPASPKLPKSPRKRKHV
ncbi:MAG: FtsQ-type POTRA domain-containing protein [Verrucomicrobiae bacterium]|nr:FtsQ-type POTRA domain-containing protein [Verrucomicrobiae bacterium]MDW8308989.1 FtsQ-type POTRA domain-containing protein [Verrucomicrobiales bacterium]